MAKEVTASLRGEQQHLDSLLLISALAESLSPRAACRARVPHRHLCEPTAVRLVVGGGSSAARLPLYLYRLHRSWGVRLRILHVQFPCWVSVLPSPFGRSPAEGQLGSFHRARAGCFARRCAAPVTLHELRCPRLRTRKYVKDGVTRYSTEIVATEVKFLDPKRDAAPESVAPVTEDMMEDAPF